MYFFNIFFAFLIRIKEEQKRRDSVPLPAVINHSFLGASAY